MPREGPSTRISKHFGRKDLKAKVYHTGVLEPLGAGRRPVPAHSLAHVRDAVAEVGPDAKKGRTSRRSRAEMTQDAERPRGVQSWSFGPRQEEPTQISRTIRAYEGPTRPTQAPSSGAALSSTVTAPPFRRTQEPSTDQAHLSLKGSQEDCVGPAVTLCQGVKSSQYLAVPSRLLRGE